MFAKGMFTIDPNSSPEQLKRKRDMIAGVVGNLGNARYTGQGLGQLAQGIMAGIQNRKMNKIESGNTAAASSMFDSLFAGGGGGDYGQSGGYGGGSPFIAPPPKSQWNQGTDVAAEDVAAMGARGDWNGGTMDSGLFNAFGKGDATGGYDMGTGGHNHASHAGQSHADWLKYSNQGATRNDPLAPELVNAMSFLGDMGITMDVISGGQEDNGPNGTGSTRHNHGNSADADFYKDGRKLDWNNPADLPLLVQIVQTAKANGVTGIGAGDDYMGAGRFHVGFGTPGVWGAGGKSANAPSWLVEAYNGAPTGSAPQGGAPTGGSFAPFNPSMFGQIDDAAANPLPAFVSGQGGQPNIPPGFDMMMQGFSGPNTAELMKALSNPWLTPEQRSVLAIELEQAQKVADPMYQMQLKEQQLKLQAAQGGGQPAALAEREAMARAGGLQPNTPEWNNYMLSGEVGGGDQGMRPMTPDEMAQYGIPPNSGAWGIGPDNKPVQIMEAPTPEKPPAPTDDMREYDLAVSQGFKGTFADYLTGMKKAGAASTTVNNVTGGNPEKVGASLAETQTAAATTIGAIDELLADPALATVTGSVMGGGGNNVDEFGVLKRLQYGDAGLATIQKIGQLQNTTWLAARDMLKGGGAITDYESKKAEAAMGRLSRAQGDNEFRAALTDLRDAITEGQAKLQAARAGGGTATPAPAGDMPQITSDADYDALPSGTQFVAPDGSVRVKP